MKKVLIAEDDTFLANAYRVKFENEGFSIEMARDGEEALQKIKSYKPDIVLLDLVMPKKDGFTVLEEIKKDPETNMIKVIVTSNLGQKEDVDRVMKLGALKYFVKSDTSITSIAEMVKNA